MKSRFLLPSLPALIAIVFLSHYCGAQPARRAIPKIGIPYTTADKYKPVVGKPGGRFVDVTLGEPKSFNPVTSGETSTSDYTVFMFQGLTDIDMYTSEVKPLIAESWTVSPDGLVWTFKIRKDIVFNDGTPLTARDVVFTYNDCIFDIHRPPGTDPRWPSSQRDICTFNGKIPKIELVDDYTVRMTLPQTVAIWGELMAEETILSEKKYRPMVENNSFGGAMGSDAKPEDIVGTGPFMLGQYVRGEKVILKRNPHYWEKDAKGQRYPYLDEYVMLLSRDINTMLINFQQKVADYYPCQSGKDVAELKPKQQEGNFDLYQLGAMPYTNFVCFNMNLDAAAKRNDPAFSLRMKWFRDPRFRQAVSYGIDRNALAFSVLRGIGYPQAGPYTLPGSGKFVFEDIKPYPHDVNKVKALLAEMGFKPGSDGMLRDPQGNKLSFTINTNSGNTVREEMANFVRTDLAKLGMEVNTLFLEFNLLVDKIDNSFDWDCLVFSFTSSPDPEFGANLWKSDAHLHLWWPSEKTPSFPWEKRIDDIFEQGMREMDPAKRRALFHEWVQIIDREQPMVYTAMPERVIALRRKFGNFFPPAYPNRYAPLNNLKEWFVLDSAR